LFHGLFDLLFGILEEEFGRRIVRPLVPELAVVTSAAGRRLKPAVAITHAATPCRIVLAIR
jgi:hypothetical protein